MTRENPLIVISDREKSLSQLYEVILTGKSFRCISIPDKAYLLDRLGAIRPDLVITDIGTPGMEGLRFLASVKSRIFTRDVPVIVISTNSELGAYALGLGASGFIAKPFEADEFVEAVASALVCSPWPKDIN